MTATDTIDTAAGTALVTLPEKDIPALFADPATAEKVIVKIEERARSEVFDMTARDSREACRSLAAQVARSKTLLDGAGKALGDDARKTLDQINGVRKTVRDRLDALKEEVRRPLTEWEAAEGKRVEALEKRIAGIDKLGAIEITASSDAIAEAISAVAAVVVESFDDYQRDAEAAVQRALGRLQPMLELAREREQQQREIERLRAEAAEQARIERERREKEEAEQRAREEAERREQDRIAAEKAAAEKAEREAQEKIERAERAQREAEERAEVAAQAERNRAEAERRAQEAADRKRAEDEAHRLRILTAIAEAMISVGGITEDQAKLIIDGIITGKIPHVRIGF